IQVEFKGKLVARAEKPIAGGKPTVVTVQLEGGAEANKKNIGLYGGITADIGPWATINGRVKLSPQKKNNDDVQVGKLWAEGDIRVNFGLDVKPQAKLIEENPCLEVKVEGKLRGGASYSLLRGGWKFVGEGAISIVLNAQDPLGLVGKWSRRYQF